MYKVIFHKLAQNDLKKLAPKEKTKIIGKIEELVKNPFSPNTNATKLKNLPKGYRLRIGKIRVVYELNTITKVLIIWKIRPRGSVYSN